MTTAVLLWIDVVCGDLCSGLDAQRRQCTQSISSNTYAMANFGCARTAYGVVAVHSAQGADHNCAYGAMWTNATISVLYACGGDSHR